MLIKPWFSGYSSVCCSNSTGKSRTERLGLEAPRRSWVLPWAIERIRTFFGKRETCPTSWPDPQHSEDKKRDTGARGVLAM